MGSTTFTDGVPVAPVFYTSPVYLFASQVDVEFVWSQFGVNVRLDDNLDGASDAGLMNRALEKASVKINFMLCQIYAVSVVRQTQWAKWCCAYITAVTIARRRGNPVPEDLVLEAQDYIDELTAISQGESYLILDNGTIAPPIHDNSGTVSNLVVDNRYWSARIRRRAVNSTVAQQEGNRKQFDATDPFYYW
jgi:hypothetical protein